MAAMKRFCSNFKKITPQQTYFSSAPEHLLITRELMPILYQANQIHTKVVGNKLNFDVNNRKFSSGINTKGYLARAYIMLAVVLAIIARLFRSKLNKQKQNGSGLSLEEIMCMMLLWLCILVGERYRFIGNHPTEFPWFLTGVLELEQFKNPQEPPTAEMTETIKKVQSICKSTRTIHQYVFELCISFSCVLKPTIPFNVIWILDHGDDSYLGDSTVLISLVNLIRFLINFCVWDMICMQTFCVKVDILVGTLSLKFCHHLVERRIVGIIKQYGLASCEPSSELFKKVQRESILYRAFQILLESFNQSMRTLLFLNLLVGGVCHVVPAMALLGNSTQIPVPLQACFVVVVIQTFQDIVVFYDFPGEFQRDSKNLLGKLRRSAKRDVKGFRGWRYLQKFLDSCQVPRMRFGMSNFIDKTTPPIFEMFCVDRIVDYLLVSKQKR